LNWSQIELVFPVVGKTKFRNDWQNPRDGGRRHHEGNDLLAKKMTPVVAVADGKVSWVRAKRGGECCYLDLTHESQNIPFFSRYLHLNNDTPGTDDGKVVGIAKGIKKGVKVRAGQLIGWVGDSGNAEGTSPHLHFELHDEFGRPVNPYPMLQQAVRLEKVRYGATAKPMAATIFYFVAPDQDDFEQTPWMAPRISVSPHPSDSSSRSQ